MSENLREFYATKNEATRKAHVTTMEHKGKVAILRRAPKLREMGSPHTLPPGEPVPVFPVDALPGCPEDHLRGPGNFVCPVHPDWGLWFDWTLNDRLNTAVLPSVKGMNPVTGQKLEGLALERYVEKCPVHETPFLTGNLCEKCGYKWPPQSYICSPNTLWWDGFRQPDGTVRQFFFTAEEERDVASAVIGKKNTVPAFGFAFFEPKTRREEEVRTKGGGFYASPPTSPVFGWGGMKSFSPGGQQVNSIKKAMYRKKLHSSDVHYQGLVPQDNMIVNQPDECELQSLSCEVDSSIQSTYCCNSPEVGSSGFEAAPIVMAAPEEPPMRFLRSVDLDRSVSVGAGAEIRQELLPDTLKVSEWKDEAAGIIRLYFVFEPEFKRILKKGIRDLSGSSEGYLKGVKVGG